MAAEADKVVVELIAENAQFDAAVKQSAAGYQAGMKQIETSGAGAETSHKRLTASVGNSRIAMLEFQHIARGTADQIAAGAPLTQVLAQHMGMLGQAVSLAGGTFGAFGAFLGGPWGLALTVAAAGVATLIMRHKDEGDAVETALGKLKKHHDQVLANDEAQKIYDHTVEGSIDLMNKLTAEIDKQNLTLEDNIALKKAAIAGSLADVVGNIGTVSAQLAQAILSAREAQRIVDDIQSGKLQVGENPAAALISAQTGLQDARQKVADLTSQLLGLNAAAEGGAKALRSVDFPLFERDAKAAADPIATVNRRFDAMAEAAKKAGTYTRDWAIQNEKLRDSAIKAAQAAERLGKSSGEFGRQISFGDAAAIARAAGLNVTSAQRSTAHQAELFNDPSVNRPGNPVARPGTSAHEGVNGKWALDIAFAPGLTAESLKKLYGGEGVNLTAVYKERGHFHIEGQRTQAESAADRDRARVAAEIARAEQRNSERLGKDLFTEQEVTVAKGEQRDLLNEMLGGNLTLAELMRSDILPSLKAWEEQYQQIKDSQQELNRFGGQLIDDVLNPDNWTSWGDMGKRILRELEMEFIQLAAINPLKNLLFGSKLPTLLSGLSGLFGGGGAKTLFPIVNGVDPLAPLPAFAGGGAFPVSGSAGDTNVLSINGVRRAIVSGDETIAVIPNNAKAIAPGSSAPPGYVYVRVEPSPYFDGRVMEVSGPVIARAAVGAANGGATIGRRNLARESQHRLE